MVTTRDFSEKTTARLYRVQEGDDLCSIAARLYGHPDYWVFIYGANAETIATHHGVHPGQILYLPNP